MGTLKPPRTLFAKYALVLGSLASVTMLGAGAIEMIFQYRENYQHIKAIQELQAEVVATRIRGTLDSLVNALRDVVDLPWDPEALTMEDRRQEFHRLLNLFPAILQLSYALPGGVEKLFVSRIAPDRLDGRGGSSTDAIPNLPDRDIYYGPAYFRDDTEPYITVGVRDRSPSAGFTVAEVNAKFLAEALTAFRLEAENTAFIVDREGRIIAHQDFNVMLGNTAVPQYATRLASLPDPTTSSASRSSFEIADLHGDTVLASAASLPEFGWFIVVQRPLAEAVRPLYAILGRTFLLLLIAIVLSLIASYVLARRLSQPIMALRRSASRIASGQLDETIEVDTRDELHELGTDFNMMAAQLKESYAGLEAKVTARTRELEDMTKKANVQSEALGVLNSELGASLAELEIRKDEAERANAAKTRFLAAASHDLRQPMHVIGLLVGILHDRLEDSTLASLAAKVESSVQTMETLFSALLDISKLDAHAVSADVIAFPIGRLLRDVHDSYSTVASQKQIGLSVVYSSAHVASDPALLERIVRNLVSNAIRYTHVGKVVVGCRRRGGRLKIEVWDTGVGIAPADIDNVFEEFFQVADAGRNRNEGLGLGLSIVKRTAELLGHPVSVRSMPGRGSVFSIEVPIAKKPVALMANTELPHDRTALDGAFVLVIDDQEENRAATEALCEHWGCYVVSAGSTDEALEKLEAHASPPDLIICDYDLGTDENGVGAIARIRSEAGEEIAAIIVTGDVSAPNARDLSVSGHRVLHKPLDADQLRRAAEAAMPGYASLQSARR